MFSKTTFVLLFFLAALAEKIHGSEEAATIATRGAIQDDDCEGSDETIYFDVRQHTYCRLFKELKKQQELCQKENKNLETTLVRRIERIFEEKLEEKAQKIIKQVTEEQSETLRDIRECACNRTVQPRTRSRNCLEVFIEGGKESGIYTIEPNHAKKSFQVLCDMERRGGGWTYVLNRFNGTQDFFLEWDDYKKGFGDLSNEFWLGLQHLFELTGFQENELLVELVDWDNKTFYALYDRFGIGSEEDGYNLKTLAGYTGTAGDSLVAHLNLKFSTKDRDQDNWGGNCASHYHGAWWYGACYVSQLTGEYFQRQFATTANYLGMTWSTHLGYGFSFKEARMMVRPKERV